MTKLHQDLSMKELGRGDVECPVCSTVGHFYAKMLGADDLEYVRDAPRYRGAHGYFGLLGLTCCECEFELIKRTPREALWVEETTRTRRSYIAPTNLC